MTFAVLAMATLALALPASSIAHRTVKVEAGESIQAAIDAAKPGTTIKIEAGTYSEALRIDKDGIELVGEGRKKTNLVPPAGEPTDCVFAPAGICVNDAADENHRVRDVEISHLSVKGFIFGIFFFNTKNGEVTRTIASDNAAYGMFFNNSTGANIGRNVTANDGEAGIYVGDSPNADATVWKNVSYGSAFGVFIRDAAHGAVLKNKTFSNCAGILFLNTDETAVPPGQTPGPVIDTKDWLAKQNNATANNKVCPPEEGSDEPPVSGIGIGIAAASDIDVIDNGVYGNVPPADAPFGGGIVIVGLPEFTPPRPSTDIKVGFNTALGNTPDLFWDEAQGSTARFFANDCLTSQPDGLCENPDVEGDDNGDDHSDDGGHHGGDNHHGDRHHKKHKKHKGGKHSKHKKKNKKHFKHHDD
jgi:hypothetical protein